MADKSDLKKYSPKVNTDGRIKVVVTGRLNVVSNDPRVVVERKK